MSCAAAGWTAGHTPTCCPVGGLPEGNGAPAVMVRNLLYLEKALLSCAAMPQARTLKSEMKTDMGGMAWVGEEKPRPACWPLLRSCRRRGGWGRCVVCPTQACASIPPRTRRHTQRRTADGLSGW